MLFLVNFRIYHLLFLNMMILLWIRGIHSDLQYTSHDKLEVSGKQLQFAVMSKLQSVYFRFHPNAVLGFSRWTLNLCLSLGAPVSALCETAEELGKTEPFIPSFLFLTVMVLAWLLINWHHAFHTKLVSRRPLWYQYRSSSGAQLEVFNILGKCYIFPPV